MLKAIHNLCKLYDLVTSIIVINANLYAMHMDPLKRYDHPKFQMSNDLVRNSYDAFHMVLWYLESRPKVNMLHFHSIVCLCCIGHVPMCLW
jgi:hypothetical protein